MNGTIIKIGGEIPEQTKENLERVLQNHSGTFTIKATEIEGIDPTVVAHSLNTNPSIKPVIQKSVISQRRGKRL